MSKTVKRFLILEILLFIVYLAFLIICRLIDLDVSESLIFVIFQLIVLLSTFGFLFAILISSIKQGFSNVRKCDDPVFAGIDKHKECKDESDNFYLKLIQIINYYYKENGKVDELISNQEIMRLYARVDFLSTQNDFYDHYIMCVCSLALGVSSSLLVQSTDKRPLEMLIWLVLLVPIIIFIIVFRFNEKGKAGSYSYLAAEYEKKLLEERINCYEESLQINDINMSLLDSKQAIISALMKKARKKRGRSKKQIISDIKKVNRLDLQIETADLCHIEEIRMDEIEYCLVYDKEKGLENNYVGDRNLINKDYSILYGILEKHKMIE